MIERVLPPLPHGRGGPRHIMPQAKPTGTSNPCSP